MTVVDPGGPRREVVADGFVTLDVPELWHAVRQQHEGVELVVSEPEQEGLFRANLVVTVAPVEMSFADWQTGTDVVLVDAFDDYLLLDLEKLQVGGHPGGRRLATYATKENESVTLQQWATLVDGRGVSLTVTSSTITHATHAELVANIVGSLQVGGAA